MHMYVYPNYVNSRWLFLGFSCLPVKPCCYWSWYFYITSRTNVQHDVHLPMTWIHCELPSKHCFWHCWTCERNFSQASLLSRKIWFKVQERSQLNFLALCPPREAVSGCSIVTDSTKTPLFRSSDLMDRGKDSESTAFPWFKFLLHTRKPTGRASKMIVGWLLSF